MLLENLVKRTGRALGVAGLSLALTACPSNGNGGNGVPAIVSCASANIPTNSSILLLENYSLPLDFSSFDENCQVYKKDGEFFAIPRTQSDKERVELEGMVQVFPSTNDENLLNIIGEPGRRLFNWLTEEQEYQTRTGQNTTFKIQEHFTIEQLQTIATRFGVEGQYNQDFVLATIDYFNSSIEHDTSNVTAWSVRGTSWPLGWHAGFPLASHNTGISGFEKNGILEGYTPLNWRDIDNPLTYLAIEFGSGSSYDDSRYDACSLNYEPKVFSSPVIDINPEYVYNQRGGNMPVLNMFYGDAEVKFVRIDELPDTGGKRDMSIILEYIPSKSLINADSVRIVYSHISGRDGSMADPSIPQVGEIIKPQQVFAYLNPAYPQMAAGGFLLDYFLMISDDSSIPGINYDSPPGTLWHGFKKADDMLESHDNDTSRVIGKNHFLYNNMVSVGSNLVMNRSALQPCYGFDVLLPEHPLR